MKKRPAFTLVELIIVITMIGILAVALGSKLMGGPGRARDAQRKADLATLSTALELYANDHAGDYPTSSSSCVADILSELSMLASPVNDPNPNSIEEPWSQGCATGYTYIGLKNGYVLAANLENTADTSSSTYSAGSFEVDPSGHNSLSKVLEANKGKACAGGDAVCEGKGVVYVIGR